MKRYSNILPYSKKWTSGNIEIDRFLEETKSNSIESKLKNSSIKFSHFDSPNNIQQLSNSSNDPGRSLFEKITINKSTDDSTEFDQNKSLKWIPYNEFSNLVEIGKGGFGAIYSAIWHDAPEQKYDLIWNKKRVVLKILYGSNESTRAFLNELRLHYLCMDSGRILPYYGISQEPSTKYYILVMQYASEGDLRNYLDHAFTRFNWWEKVKMLHDVIIGLKAIHSIGLVHHDFHSGNILRHGYGSYGSNLDTYISDLGLSNPVDSTKVYGVLPYVAPEVLRGDRYTKAADIYSLGIVMWEITSGEKPWVDRSHNIELAMDICNGLRPEIVIGTPDCYIQVMKRCWDANPLSRPTVEDLIVLVRQFRKVPGCREQINDAEHSRLATLENILKIKKTQHSEATYSSRLLDFPDLPLPKNAQSDYPSTVKRRVDFEQLVARRRANSITIDNRRPNRSLKDRRSIQIVPSIFTNFSSITTQAQQLPITPTDIPSLSANEKYSKTFNQDVTKGI